MLPEFWRGCWLDPKAEGTQELINAAVQSVIPVAAGLSVYEIAPLRGDGSRLIQPEVDAVQT